MRDVNLTKYLPQFLKEYKELMVTLKAENPEFKLAWEAVDRVLRNMFIETADEYGISRFENILGALPSTEDLLETRRKKVMFLWNFKYPYTMQYLKEKLYEICGDNYYVSLEGYYLKIITHLYQFEDMDNRCILIRELLREIIPCNMVIECVSMIRHFELKQFTHQQIKKFTNSELKKGSTIIV